MESRKVHRFPCDGVARYTTKENPGRLFGRVPYSEAWETIVKETGCPRDAKTITFNREAIRRLGKLNAAYLGVARPFLRGLIEEKRRKAAAAAPAITVVEAKPPGIYNPP